MATIKLPEKDPTLAAADDAMLRAENAKPRRAYLGMSQIGHPCSRMLWYSFHDPLPRQIPISGLRAINDGHTSEEVMAHRLKQIEGVELATCDENGEQFAVSDFDGKFAGHMDGAIHGLLQAPKTWHVWEAKATNEKKFKKLRDLKMTLGEKNTLKVWDETYYAQAQCYMGYTGMRRHYLTVSTPGVRDWEAVRTDFNAQDFEALKDKANRIINARAPLAKISNDPSWFQCSWCDYRERCHGTETIPT